MGVGSLDEVEDMTLQEYELRMKAFNLSRIDRERELHWQAFLNNAVQQTKERGKRTVPVYPTFKSFFDYEKHVERATGEQVKKKEKHSKIKQLVLIANMRGGQDE